jgi:hypothetical protein
MFMDYRIRHAEIAILQLKRSKWEEEGRIIALNAKNDLVKSI